MNYHNSAWVSAGTATAKSLGMNKKLTDLKKCIARVARVASPLAPYWSAPGKRFVALWQARNRRTRVLMFRGMN